VAITLCGRLPAKEICVVIVKTLSPVVTLSDEQYETNKMRRTI